MRLFFFLALFQKPSLKMSKRANENQDPVVESKRSRSTKESHAPDCTDSLCQGCDVGEVEISFVRKDANGQPIDTEPSAQELLAMAIDEAANDNNEDESNGMASRLFDMAIEKYQKDEPDNRVGYATCLVELGRAIQVEESISEGLEILRGEIKKQPKNKDVLLKLAGAAIALATSKRKNQDAYFEKQEAELEGSDGEMDEVAYGELLQKQELSKDDIKLYKEAIQRANEAFEDIESEDESILKEAQTVMHELRAYGQLLNQPFHQEHSDAVLDAVIQLIQKIPGNQENDELLTLWAACLLHQEKFIEDKKKQLATLNKADALLIKSNKIHIEKHGKGNPWVYEMV
jgi:tetratricopeptide (TPR) repeat protein